MFVQKVPHIKDQFLTQERASMELESVQQLDPTEAADLLGLAEGGSRISTQNSEIYRSEFVHH